MARPITPSTDKPPPRATKRPGWARKYAREQQQYDPATEDRIDKRAAKLKASMEDKNDT